MHSTNITYISKLDHIRFIAAFMVLMFHSNLLLGTRDSLHLPLLDQGYSGVALFMVISGMILTLITTNRDIYISKFYINRALRIYPLFIFIVTLGYFSTPDPRQSSVGIEYLLSLLPISNLYRLSYGPYGGHLWSIMVEIQFYILFPVLAMVNRQQGAKFYIALIIFMMIMRGLVFALNGTIHQLAYFSIFGNLELFLIGGLTGMVYVNFQKSTGRYLWFVVLVCINIIIYAVHHYFGFMHFDYTKQYQISNSAFWIFWPTIQGIMWSALIITYLRSSMHLSFLSQVFSSLGKISYSIYVWHIFVMLLVSRYVGQIFESNYLTGLVIVLPATLLLSFLSYHLIESPFLALRVRYIKEA